MDALLKSATDEIVRLHTVIEGWFQGTLPIDRFDDAFADALHRDFLMIQPAGVVLDRTQTLDSIYAAHGANPAFCITIEDPHVIGTWPGLIAATYVESQSGARNSASSNRRRSSVLFETGPRLLWRHLHETGLPG